LPRVVARFNKRVTNRFLEPIARRSAGFAVVHHVGRRSNREYTTPVNLFALGDDAIVALTYGPDADWVQNVIGAGGTVENRVGERRIDQAAVVGRDVAWPVLPSVVRGALRVMRVRDFMRVSFEPFNSFGPFSRPRSERRDDSARRRPDSAGGPSSV